MLEHSSKTFARILGQFILMVIIIFSLGIMAQAAEHVVSEKDKKFSVKKLDIAVGDSVKIVNDDAVKHNVMNLKLGYNSGLQEPGSSSTLKFDKNGKFLIRCGIHPKMKMKITVK